MELANNQTEGGNNKVQISYDGLVDRRLGCMLLMECSHASDTPLISSLSYSSSFTIFLDEFTKARMNVSMEVISLEPT